MYLFQRFGLFGNNGILTNLHSTMYLFQPASGGGQLWELCIYIPLCIYFNYDEGGETIDTVSIYIPLCIYFNLLEIILIWYLYQNLHSTMYLFQLVLIQKLELWMVIYIPLCIYFNINCAGAIRINCLHLHSTMYLFQRFWLCLFHIKPWYLHSTMYLFQLRRGSM